MQLTNHAHTRMQQRGITKSILDLLDAYGRYIERGKAGAVVYFDNRARELIRKNTPRKEFARIEQKLNAYFIEANDGSILTVWLSVQARSCLSRAASTFASRS